MTINDQLMQPMLDRIEQEYKDLLEEVNDLYTEEARELRTFIHKKLRQLQMVRVSLCYMNQFDRDLERDQFNIRETLRQHKLELRFARRRWKRQQAQFEKTGQSSRVPTFAA